jgi:hypothetical protein
MSFMLHHENILRISLLPYLTTYPTHLNFPDIITLIILARNTNHEAGLYAIFSIFPLLSLSQLGRNNFLSTLHSNNLCMTDQVLRLYRIKKSGKIINLYTLIFIFLTANEKLKDCLSNVCRHFLNLICSYFLHECKFYLSFTHFDISPILQRFVLPSCCNIVLHSAGKTRIYIHYVLTNVSL